MFVTSIAFQYFCLCWLFAFEDFCLAFHAVSISRTVVSHIYNCTIAVEWKLEAIFLSRRGILFTLSSQMWDTMRHVSVPSPFRHRSATVPYPFRHCSVSIPSPFRRLFATVPSLFRLRSDTVPSEWYVFTLLVVFSHLSEQHISDVPRGGVWGGGSNPPFPRNSEGPPKSCQTQLNLLNSPEKNSLVLVRESRKGLKYIFKRNDRIQRGGFMFRTKGCVAAIKWQDDKTVTVLMFAQCIHDKHFIIQQIHKYIIRRYNQNVTFAISKCLKQSHYRPGVAQRVPGS